MHSSAQEGAKRKAAERAQRAATVELHLQAFRCAEILAAYPEQPTEGDRLRFSHGLARELWTVSNAMGMYAAASFASLAGNISLPNLLQVLLQQAEWRGTELLIDIGKLDWQFLLKNYAPRWSFEDTGLWGNEWWKGPQNLFEAMNRPSWMTCDQPSVPRPMCVHQRDVGDASTVPGEIYSLAMHHQAEARYHMELEARLRKDVLDALSGNSSVPEPSSDEKR